jgi:tRNA pseudouridine38-40 synthase
MRNVKLTIEYDGTHLHGFQIQKRKRTVQGELEKALKTLFRRKIRVAGSGRTDAGVHARGQVVSFQVDSDILTRKIRAGLNRYLPADISVRDVKDAPLNFHAQFSAKWKTYEYKILQTQVRSPLERFDTFWLRYELDLKKMKRAACVLLGKHNFRSFESSGSARKSAVRTVRSLSVSKTGDVFTILIQADGFLYKMVRTIAGLLVDVGSGKLSLGDVKVIIKSKNRKAAGWTAPARGLCLKQVTY